MNKHACLKVFKATGISYDKIITVNIIYSGSAGSVVKLQHIHKLVDSV